MKNDIKSIITSVSGLSARNYQIDTIEECLRLYIEKNYHAILIESPTGSGKTVMGMTTAIMLARFLNKQRIGWVAMRRNLLTQAAEVATAFGVKNFFPISMFEKNPPKVDILIVDEAHHDATMSMASLHKKILPLKVLGLSATPLRTDKAELIFEKSISKTGIFELVRLGYLAKPDHYVISDWEVDTVVDTYLEDHKKWGKSILFFFTMEECLRAQEKIKKAKIDCEIVHATSDKETILQKLENDEINVLINMAILTEGFDCPKLETVFVRPSSRPLTQQMAGRVLRIVSGIRKKIVQSQDSRHPFNGIAPVGRSFKRKPDGSWMPLDYDQDIIQKLISNSNTKMGERLSSIEPITHQIIKFFSEKESSRSED